MDCLCGHKKMERIGEPDDDFLYLYWCPECGRVFEITPYTRHWYEHKGLKKQASVA